MAFHLKPKEEKFFNLLDKHAALSYAAADILKEAVNEEISKKLTPLKKRRMIWYWKR